jgi:hypothetical protein
MNGFMQGASMKRIAIKKLRPTQATQGRREVEKKTKEYAVLAGRELEMAIAEKPNPIVLGPGRRSVRDRPPSRRRRIMGGGYHGSPGGARRGLVDA